MLAGITHDVTQWQAGDHVEMYEVGGTSFAIYELAPNTNTTRPGQQTFKACLRHAGNPLDRIQYRFRIFDASTGIDFEEADERFVNATGDTMTGRLKLEKPLWIRKKGSNEGGWHQDSMLIVNQQDGAGGSIARFKKNGTDALKVQYDMNTSVENHNLIKLADPINKTDAVNLQTLERELAKVSPVAEREWYWKDLDSSGNFSKYIYYHESGDHIEFRISLTPVNGPEFVMDTFTPKDLGPRASALCIYGWGTSGKQNTIYSGTAYKFECYEKSNHRHLIVHAEKSASLIWKPKQLSNNHLVSVNLPIIFS